MANSPNTTRGFKKKARVEKIENYLQDRFNWQKLPNSVQRSFSIDLKRSKNSVQADSKSRSRSNNISPDQRPSFAKDTVMFFEQEKELK